MDTSRLIRRGAHEWEIPATGAMRVPGILYASEALLADMDDKVAEQVTHVAGLPGIVGASYAMPDAHWGYGFPIGGVAAMDPDTGVVSAGGVGFDISCGVRCLLTGLAADEVRQARVRLADRLAAAIPAGVGSKGALRLSGPQLDAMLTGGARWAVEAGHGEARDLPRIEQGGRVPGARPECVSDQAKERVREQVGTLGSGNHYLEVQEVAEIHDAAAAAAFGLRRGDAVVSIHCGSRGLGHQIGTDYLKRMVVEAPRHGLKLPDRELACAPLSSDLGQGYLGAMRAGINCALANRQVVSDLARRALQRVFPHAELRLLYDVSHNTCKEETHRVGGRARRLFVHRKGATRAFPPGHPELPDELRATGQPVLIGGSMGTGSHVLVGVAGNEQRSFSSACHGAGRAMSRTQARKRWRGARVVAELAARGIEVRSPSPRGVAEEAPDAYKDVDAVVDAAQAAGLARKVAFLAPLVCVKG